MNFKDDVNKYLNIEISDYQLQQFDCYYQFLIEYNSITNLTRITEESEVYYKHFFDSLTLAQTVSMDKVDSLCDMGAGAGFPSIPLKIVFPHLNITIIDSLNKRIVFLDKLIEKINLKHVETVHERVEIYASNHQNHFDLVTARALGDLALITEMGLPMVKINGVFVGFKTINYEEELIRAKQTIILLGSEIIKTREFSLPHQMGERVHIVLKKIKHVKGYPRAFSLMKNKPL